MDKAIQNKQTNKQKEDDNELQGINSRLNLSMCGEQNSKKDPMNFAPWNYSSEYFILHGKNVYF